MKKLKKFVVGVVAAVAGLLLVPNSVMAATCPPGTQWAGTTIGEGNIQSIAQCNMPKDDTSVQTDNLWKTIQNIINWVLAILGLVAVIMIILGGFNYMTSQGDPAKTKRGRDTILYGIVDLIIGLLAFAIVNFVLANVFGDAGTTADTSRQEV